MLPKALFVITLLACLFIASLLIASRYGKAIQGTNYLFGLMVLIAMYKAYEYRNRKQTKPHVI